MITKAVIPAAGLGTRLLLTAREYRQLFPKHISEQDNPKQHMAKKPERSVRTVTHKGGKVNVLDPEISENQAKELAQELKDVVEGRTKLYTVEGKEMPRKKPLAAQS